MSFARRKFSYNKRSPAHIQSHREYQGREPLHILIPSHPTRQEEEQIVPYVSPTKGQVQQGWQSQPIDQSQPASDTQLGPWKRHRPRQLYDTLYQPRERGLVLSTHFVDQSAVEVYSSGDFVLLWNGETRVIIKNIARNYTEADNQYHISILPTFSDSSVTSIYFCSNYLFYSTETAVYALQVVGGIGPIQAQAIHLFRKRPTDPGPLHSLRVHMIDNLYVVIVCAGYGIQCSSDISTYSPSPATIIVCEISVIMLKNSGVCNLDATSNVPLELSSSVHAYKYVLDGPIFAITTAIDQTAIHFFKKLLLHKSRLQSVFPDTWPYNLLNDQLAVYDKASFLKICVSTITTRPEILIVSLLLNLTENLMGGVDNHDIVFFKVWHLPFINMSTGITTTTLTPAKEPLALSDDGSWLMCWSTTTKTKYAIWILAFDVSFSSLIHDDFYTDGIGYHQFSLPLSCSITRDSNSTPPYIIQLLGTNFSSTRIFYILCHTGYTTTIYTFILPRSQYYSSTPQQVLNKSCPTLVRIDKEHLGQDTPSLAHSISIASYRYTYSDLRNESQKQCEGFCILWSDGSLSLAKNYQPFQSQSTPSSNQQFKRKPFYNNNRFMPSITVVTKQQ